MKQFLSIVLREQFTFFYRAGYTFIPASELISFEGEIDDSVKEKVVEKFKTVTPFEYEEEYLILHLEKETSNEGDFIQFDIQSIIAIYPLSQQAKISIESKIDQRIHLENPIFESLLPSIEAEIINTEVEKAISALWTICKIKSPLEKYITNIELENIFNGLEHRKHGTKANKIQNGNYWEYLIAYDRFDFFPNSILGYFYDAGQVLAYSKGHPSFEGSGIHTFLEKFNSANSSAKFPDIIKLLETEEQLKGYVNQTTVGELKQYIIAPLYLMLRDEIRKSKDISQTKLFKNLEYLKTFDDSFKYVVILLGAFFGFRKFYDLYYEALNLRFYKDFKAPKKEIEKDEQQEVKTVVEEENLNDNTEIKIEENAPETKVEEKNKDRQAHSKLNEYTGIQKQVFESLLKIFDEEKGTFEIKTDRLTELKKTLSPLSIKQKISKKDDVVRIINEYFKKDIKVENKGNKYFISRNIEGDLFANS